MLLSLPKKKNVMLSPKIPDDPFEMKCEQADEVNVNYFSLLAVQCNQNIDNEAGNSHHSTIIKQNLFFI